MLFYFKILAVLAVALLVWKRAIKGPQKTFARFALLMVLAGFFALGGASAKGDFAASVGAILLLVGMVFAGVMICVDIVWTARTSLKRK